MFVFFIFNVHRLKIWRIRSPRRGNPSNRGRKKQAKDFIPVSRRCTLKDRLWLGSPQTCCQWLRRRPERSQATGCQLPQRWQQWGMRRKITSLRCRLAGFRCLPCLGWRRLSAASPSCSGERLSPRRQVELL